MSGKAIHDDMLATLGHNTPAYSVVKSLLAKFKRGRNRVEDEHRSGRPKDAASTENIHIVDDKLKGDRRLTIRHIAETTDIHATTAYQIVSDNLGMKKVSARWVPRMFTNEQKQNRVDVCTDLLCRLQAQPQIFLDRIVTQDETWVHHFVPETKDRVWSGNMRVRPPLRSSRSPYMLERSHGYCFWDSMV